MTGYGRANISEDGREIMMELKSVNHRYLDIGFKIGKSFAFAEDRLKQVIAGKILRGHLDVFLNYKNTRNDSKTIKVDYVLLAAYLKAFYEAAEQAGLKNDITLTSAMRLNDVLSIEEEEEDLEALTELLEKVCSAAVDSLFLMREREGNKLAEDIRQRIGVVGQHLEIIKQKAPTVVAEYREKLLKRLEELLNGQDLDQNRIGMEVAFFADKCNIDEEIVRLGSHLEQFLSTMEETGAIGRKLDFIVQEINREINTIGSKASDVEITNSVLLMKNEVEKIREQVQNIE
ncbi:YicC family protein [Clostridia bacterium OttesenSCG-928-F22]|nr:YicC family protein [Clostridia bacterium OttesenSCG-928-F22]